MNAETKKQLNDLLKESRKTDSFLNDDWMTEDTAEGGPSTRRMVINMIAEGLESTDYELVLQKKK